MFFPMFFDFSSICYKKLAVPKAAKPTCGFVMKAVLLAMFICFFYFTMALPAAAFAIEKESLDFPAEIRSLMKPAEKVKPRT